jgi:hypothetical protein
MPILGTVASQFSGKSFGSYESIASATGTGSSPTITFSSIPSGYVALQIRGAFRKQDGFFTALKINFNSDTGNNYTEHVLIGNGSSASAAANTGQNHARLDNTVLGTSYTSMVGVAIVDLEDYASTTKYKTLRAFNGADVNGSGNARLTSSLWLNTNAITSITLNTEDGQNWLTSTTVSLYGIKG